MRMKLERKTDFPVIGPLFTTDWLPVTFSWGGLLLDLFVFPMLLWKPTRIPALVAAVTFHLMNAQLFNIDIFPWMMIAATVILFFPDWLPWFRNAQPARGAVAAATNIPHVARPYSPGTKLTLAALAIYLTVQILVPIRHAAYEGDADWTEEGQQFAWRMLMREKKVLPPKLTVTYRKDGRERKGAVPLPYPNEPGFWNSDWQFQKMAINPDILLQFCHKFAEIVRSQGGEEVAIHAQVFVSLNGREPRPLVDPTANLANEPRRWLTGYPWVLPLEQGNAPQAPEGGG
jgi:hypothetical protein